MTRRLLISTSRTPRAVFAWLAVCALCASLAALVACGDGDGPAPAPDAGFYTEDRPPCADRNPLRNAYYGDLHVHTRNSFDAYVWGSRNDAAAAYRFARGEPIALPPLDENGEGTQIAQLARPLDFAAVTDHAEFLGEVALCTDPSSDRFDTELCQGLRAGADDAVFALAGELTNPDPSRLVELCGADGERCPSLGASVWDRVIAAAEDAYDRSEACAFTALVGYEWTSNTAGRNLHRNVIFRNANVPARPTSYFEASTAQGLWAALARDCRAEDNCHALAIPHNSNLSNGGMFAPRYPGADDVDAERAQAAERARAEPLMEVFQHKGSSECISGISGIFGEPDELCEVEQIRPTDDDCGEQIGVLGIANRGCVSRYDFWRGQLLAGLEEELRLGVNPYRLGVIASTDTHNATPGATEEASYRGHIGSFEATPADRLGPGFEQPSGFLGNPGGLAGVWAEENSRDGIFRALATRETFGTSGTRIAPRLFGGWGYDDGLCGDPALIATGYEQGVPMGRTLPARPDGAGAPKLVVMSLRDPDPGAAPLQVAQVVKGWIDAQGQARYEVFDVAGDRENGASVDPDTCERTGAGASELCAVWTDPSFDASRPAFYYARTVENPSCRWSARDCAALPEAERPPICADPAAPRVIQEMAWTSPIWYTPR